MLTRQTNKKQIRQVVEMKEAVPGAATAAPSGSVTTTTNTAHHKIKSMTPFMTYHHQRVDM